MVDPWPNGAGAIIKKKKKWKRHQSSLSLHHTRTRWRSNWLQARKKVLIRNQIIQHLDLGPPSLQNCAQIYFCNLRPPIYGTFVMAEKSKTNIQKWHPSLPLSTVILLFIFFFLQLQIFQDLFLYIWNTVLHFLSNLHAFMSLKFLESRTCVMWQRWRIRKDRPQYYGGASSIKKCMTRHV